METLATQIRKTVKSKTPYQIIANEFNTSELYVGQIARGDRLPIRGKGLKILNRLKEITKQQIAL
jgi:hypothetical protein